MVLFSHLRKLLGVTLAMLIFATSVQPVQAHVNSTEDCGEGRGAWLVNAPSTTNSHGPLDSALYISEENEGQASRKGPSFGADEPALMLVELPSAVLLPIVRYIPPYRAPPADNGVFLSPLKTGPPSL
jgi:hypothetical protein